MNEVIVFAYDRALLVALHKLHGMSNKASHPDYVALPDRRGQANSHSTYLRHGLITALGTGSETDSLNRWNDCNDWNGFILTLWRQITAAYGYAYIFGNAVESAIVHFRNGTHIRCGR
jgi:hypothetical protein